MFKYALAESTQNALSANIKDIQIQSVGTNQISQIIDWAKQNEMINSFLSFLSVITTGDNLLNI